MRSPPRSGVRPPPPEPSQLQPPDLRERITFQITIKKISHARHLPHTENLRVGVCVDGLVKLSCVGNNSLWPRSVTKWNHPFTFTGSLLSTISIYLCTLPQPGNGWVKEHIGQEIKLDARQLLQANPLQYYCVPGLHGALKLYIDVNVTMPVVREGTIQRDGTGLMLLLRQLSIIVMNISKVQQLS
ncbi:hypothetical protein HYDPIDRAFT_34381 [Hydnomerulius pinastri MD-312]|uniref:C2 domain-containing protein n=1 Tax=Hydnomerulius pinastri MD-312 TaxID=994086 RepID=A0A0C9VY04_9AGAM|nr:hypothetical protein HYDPIDRAFT_34381 [Hydnomerulius pinastri MD-312]